MFFKKQDIIDGFYEEVGEGVVKFVSPDIVESYILKAFEDCYPKYHNKMVMETILTEDTKCEEILEIPLIVKKVCELKILNDSGTTRTFDIPLTDWDLLPEFSDASTRALKIHRELPACTLQLFAQGILEFLDEDRINVPSLTPIIQSMAVKYYTKLKAEAARKLDKEAYVIYQSQKNEALKEFHISLNQSRMAPMMCKYTSDKNRLRIANKNYQNIIQQVWKN